MKSDRTASLTCDGTAAMQGGTLLYFGYLPGHIVNVKA